MLKRHALKGQGLVQLIFSAVSSTIPLGESGIVFHSESLSTMRKAKYPTSRKIVLTSRPLKGFLDPYKTLRKAQ
jgi:hypothetical protein